MNQYSYQNQYFLHRMEFSTGTNRVSLRVPISSIGRERSRLLFGFTGFVAVGLSEKHRAS